jgi:uncharacterized protein (DUF488 family)
MAGHFYTVGHSTRPIGDFVELLKDAGVVLVADVRTVPRSRANPQYNKETLPQTLVGFGIDYRHFASLGGLRGKARSVPAATNAFWRNRSFHNFADYAISAAFRDGLDDLRHAASARPCAIMCAEALWWRCHRRIVADYLIAGHETVWHILAKGHVERAGLTGAARQGQDGILVYPDQSAPDQPDS